jgi:AICAR transformylase/IMP cyclohydrolase PurH
LTSQQTYYELKIEKNREQTERMQAALETFEKQSSRDKMIIKFREQRIQKLEEKINSDGKCKADGDAGCAEC